MNSFGLHNKMKLDDREFHVHTGSVHEKNIILSEIFEKGKFINSRQIDYFPRRERNGEESQKHLQHLANKFHKDMMEEVETLFLVHEKVKYLNQYLPHFRLGSVFFVKKFYREAIENFSRIVELKKDFVPAYHRLGLCYIKSGDYEKAIQTLASGLQIEPDFADLGNAFSVVLSLSKQYDKATDYLHQALKKNPEFDEANFNLGVVLFRSMINDADKSEKIIVPSRVTRFIKSLKILERYSNPSWQQTFDDTLEIVKDTNIDNVIEALESLQIKLITQMKINTVLDTFFLKFMYGGKELTRDELEYYERRVKEQESAREGFADYWNDLGRIHMIQCRNLFLSALSEFDKSVELNASYKEAIKNYDLVKNNKKGFLILLRAILK
ncbi:MAG: tetratricopeptide repeat protein [Calditrichia bacterium]|nr:tetratricopeptide repeat protein [Calditrichia bacterium]